MRCPRPRLRRARARVRFFNVFGPLQATSQAYAAIVPAFLGAALAGKPLTVHVDGL